MAATTRELNEVIDDEEDFKTLRASKFSDIWDKYVAEIFFFNFIYFIIMIFNNYYSLNIVTSLLLPNG